MNKRTSFLNLTVDVIRKINNNQLKHKHWKIKCTITLEHLLRSLKPSEKDYIASYVIKKEWDIGSPNVLDILQQSGILNMSDYLLQKIEADNSDEVQFMICDLLETQFSLLANLVQNFDRTDPRSQIVSHCLEEGFRRLINDIVIRRDCVKRNFLQEIKVHLSVRQLFKLRMMNLKLLIEVDRCSLVQAIGRLSEWLENNEIDENSELNVVINEILHNDEAVLEYLMKKVITDKFHGWKWYSKILKKMCSNLSDISVKVIKSFLKELFASFLSQKNQHFFFIMLMTARIVCYGNSGYFGDYQQWYKGQFTDMRYTISKNEFVTTMEALQSTVSHENDVDILGMYVRTSISPPTLLNDMVLSYKQMCRSKIERISSNNREISDKVSLVDDDDSDEMEF